MQHIVIVLAIILLNFSGCSPKTSSVAPTQKTNISQIKTDRLVNTPEDSEDTDNNNEIMEDDTSEFEDEFSAENTQTVYDPLIQYNRSMTHFNDIVFTYALDPVSVAYATVIPQPLRIGLSNFIKNLGFPVRLTNTLLQGKGKHASDEIGRFLANTTIGLLGIMDPASTLLHIPAHKEDFGQTLGSYGIGPGFHIVLPFLGPSNLRDLTGLVADGYISPLVNIRGLENYKIPKNTWESIGIVTLHMVNKNSLHPGQYQNIKKDAIDLYPFLRDIYEQKRVSKINE